MVRAKKNSLPFVFLNVAITADGKLAPANRKFVPFSSQRDQQLLLELRTQADAVMAGARTVDSTPVTLGVGGEKYRAARLANGLAESHIRVVVSGSGTLDPNAKIFQDRSSPIIILASGRIRRSRLSKLERLADVVKIFGEEELDFGAALQWLRREWQVKSLLCEGGGEINAALLMAGLVDEIYVTICPKILGGRNAPTLADGEGVEKVSEAIGLKIKSLKRVGDELFLVYRLK